jgi:hypothetical protein
MQEFRAEQGQAGDSSNPKHSYWILMKSFFFSWEENPHNRKKRKRTKTLTLTSQTHCVSQDHSLFP